MAYETPKCDCDAELVWWSQPTYTDMHRINKNRKKAKRMYWHHYEREEPYERLVCGNSVCHNEYEIEYDEKDRVIRGEDWEKVVFSRFK